MAVIPPMFTIRTFVSFVHPSSCSAFKIEQVKRIDKRIKPGSPSRAAMHFLIFPVNKSIPKDRSIPFIYEAVDEPLSLEKRERPLMLRYNRSGRFHFSGKKAGGRSSVNRGDEKGTFLFLNL
jgi:hypothetical protein